MLAIQIPAVPRNGVSFRGPDVDDCPAMFLNRLSVIDPTEIFGSCLLDQELTKTLC